MAQGLRYGFGPRRGPAAQRSDGRPELPWLQSAGLRMAKSYALPNGRRYALLELTPHPCGSSESDGRKFEIPYRT